MAYRDWIHVNSALNSGTTPPCPACGHLAVERVVVADPQTMIGFAILWCKHCFRAARMSRMIVPSNVEFVNFSEASIVVDRIPPVRSVDE